MDAIKKPISAEKIQKMKMGQDGNLYFEVHWKASWLSYKECLCICGQKMMQQFIKLTNEQTYGDEEKIEEPVSKLNEEVMKEAKRIVSGDQLLLGSTSKELKINVNSSRTSSSLLDSQVISTSSLHLTTADLSLSTPKTDNNLTPRKSIPISSTQCTIPKSQNFNTKDPHSSLEQKVSPAQYKSPKSSSVNTKGLSPNLKLVVSTPCASSKSSTNLNANSSSSNTRFTALSIQSVTQKSPNINTKDTASNQRLSSSSTECGSPNSPNVNTKAPSSNQKTPQSAKSPSLNQKLPSSNNLSIKLLNMVSPSSITASTQVTKQLKKSPRITTSDQRPVPGILIKDSQSQRIILKTKLASGSSREIEVTTKQIADLIKAKSQQQANQSKPLVISATAKQFRVPAMFSNPTSVSPVKKNLFPASPSPTKPFPASKSVTKSTTHGSFAQNSSKVTPSKTDQTFSPFLTPNKSGTSCSKSGSDQSLQHSPKPNPLKQLQLSPDNPRKSNIDFIVNNSPTMKLLASNASNYRFSTLPASKGLQDKFNTLSPELFDSLKQQPIFDISKLSAANALVCHETFNLATQPEKQLTVTQQASQCPITTHQPNQKSLENQQTNSEPITTQQSDRWLITTQQSNQEPIASKQTNSEPNTTQQSPTKLSQPSVKEALNQAASQSFKHPRDRLRRSLAQEVSPNKTETTPSKVPSIPSASEFLNDLINDPLSLKKDVSQQFDSPSKYLSCSKTEAEITTTATSENQIENSSFDFQLGPSPAKSTESDTSAFDLSSSSSSAQKIQPKIDIIFSQSISRKSSSPLLRLNTKRNIRASPVLEQTLPPLPGFDNLIEESPKEALLHGDVNLNTKDKKPSSKKPPLATIASFRPKRILKPSKFYDDDFVTTDQSFVKLCKENDITISCEESSSISGKETDVAAEENELEYDASATRKRKRVDSVGDEDQDIGENRAKRPKRDGHDAKRGDTEMSKGPSRRRKQTDSTNEVKNQHIEESIHPIIEQSENEMPKRSSRLRRQTDFAKDMKDQHLEGSKSTHHKSVDSAIKKTETEMLKRSSRILKKNDSANEEKDQHQEESKSKHRISVDSAIEKRDTEMPKRSSSRHKPTNSASEEKEQHLEEGNSKDRKSVVSAIDKCQTEIPKRSSRLRKKTDSAREKKDQHPEEDKSKQRKSLSSAINKCDIEMPKQSSRLHKTIYSVSEVKNQHLKDCNSKLHKIVDSTIEKGATEIPKRPARPRKQIDLAKDDNDKHLEKNASNVQVDSFCKEKDVNTKDNQLEDSEKNGHEIEQKSSSLCKLINVDAEENMSLLEEEPGSSKRRKKQLHSRRSIEAFKESAQETTHCTTSNMEERNSGQGTDSNNNDKSRTSVLFENVIIPETPFDNSDNCRKKRGNALSRLLDASFGLVLTTNRRSKSASSDVHQTPMPNASREKTRKRSISERKMFNTLTRKACDGQPKPSRAENDCKREVKAKPKVRKEDDLSSNSGFWPSLENRGEYSTAEKITDVPYFEPSPQNQIESSSDQKGTGLHQAEASPENQSDSSAVEKRTDLLQVETSTENQIESSCEEIRPDLPRTEPSPENQSDSSAVEKRIEQSCEELRTYLPQAKPFPVNPIESSFVEKGTYLPKDVLPPENQIEPSCVDKRTDLLMKELFSTEYEAVVVSDVPVDVELQEQLKPNGKKICERAISSLFDSLSDCFVQNAPYFEEVRFSSTRSGNTYKHLVKSQKKKPSADQQNCCQQIEAIPEISDSISAEPTLPPLPVMVPNNAYTVFEDVTMPPVSEIPNDVIVLHVSALNSVPELKKTLKNRNLKLIPI